MGMFQSASTLTFKNTVSDKFGYVQALLNDIGNEGEGLLYDDWVKLVPILKFELPDEDQAFELFDAFSSQNEFYDEDFTYTKWHGAGLEADGRLTLGSLIHVAKEQLGDKFDTANYSQFFGQEAVSKVEQFNLKIKKNKNKLPDHYLPDGLEDIKFPTEASVSHEIALMVVLEEDKTYGTATDPRQCKIVDPFAGDRLEQYITVNPVKDSRKQANVLSFKYAVLEFDTIHLDEQFSLLSSVELPYEALIFTGNKSIHAWIRIDAIDNDQHKKRTRLIAKMLSDFGYNKENDNGPDTAVLFDSSSLVRCPGTKRVDWSNKGDKSHGTMQRAIWAEESEGWDVWYKTVYPKYVVESSLVEDLEVEEEAKAFEVPIKEHNFIRTLKRVKEQFGDEYAKALSDGLEQTDKGSIREALLEAIPEFFSEWLKKNKKIDALKIADLYHLFIDSCREGGAHYEGDIQEALYNGCVNAQRYVKAQFDQRKERAQSHIDSLLDIDFDASDPMLLEVIDKEIYKASQSEKPESFEILEMSLDQVVADLNNRPAVLLRSEIHKYAEELGRLLRGEVSSKKHNEFGALYNYLNIVSYFNSADCKILPVEVKTFPSLISPYVGCVKQNNKGQFNVVQVDNDSATKLLASYMLKEKLRPVEIISEVPVFKETEEGADLILDYDLDKQCLVTKPSDGYGFMPIEEAKKIIVGLFDDFEFVHKSDLSRAIAALLTPALCHADLLHGDFRPTWYIDADGQGAGKNVLADFLTVPYVDQPAKVTQDDSSVGSIDDKLGAAIADGENIILLDNLKPTRKNKELSSPFIEALTTSETVRFRAPTQGNVNLSTSGTCLYITTNGMSLSKDMAQRSMYISIRKKPIDYKFKAYDGSGYLRWVRKNRSLVMSAIYTVLKEHVTTGKPMEKLLHPHRFYMSTGVLNSIVVNIFELPDISIGLAQKMLAKSDAAMDIVRKICFNVDKAGLLGSDLNNIAIFEVLQEAGEEESLGLPFDMEIYTDEENTRISSDAKRAIGQKLSGVMSKQHLLGKANSKKEDSSCTVEEYTLTRSYNLSNKSALYRISK